MPFIGNDLSNLTIEIRKNYFTCARSASLEEDIPVKSGLTGLKRRMSLIKLRHQADRLGLNWESNVPWSFSFKDRLLETRAKRDDLVTYGAAADLIPDPSDWIPYHSLMANPPLLCGMHFCKRNKRFFHESCGDKSIHPVNRGCMAIDRFLQVDESNAVLCESLPRPNTQLDGIDTNEKNDHIYEAARAWDILYRTVALLKEAGNEALQNTLNCLAARYYDKAIVYCSVAYMEFPVGNVAFLADHQVALSDNSGWECCWTCLLKILIQIRLNLSLCCLKTDVNDTKAAIFQAKLALKELRPFVGQKGCVTTGKKLEMTRLEEPLRTYTEAMSLQSKAFFRLGSAQLLVGDYEEAIESFEQSIKSSSVSSSEKKPDQLVLRKLQEAKLANRRHCNSERKKFKFMFSSQEDGEHNND
jgi:tetratricopeptide (TPR) repeat protein